MYRFLFIVVFVLLLAISFYPYFITDCLFIFSEVEFLSLGLYSFDIDIGDKDYDNSMVSKILI